MLNFSQNISKNKIDLLYYPTNSVTKFLKISIVALRQAQGLSILFPYSRSIRFNSRTIREIYD